MIHVITNTITAQKKNLKSDATDINKKKIGASAPQIQFAKGVAQLNLFMAGAGSGKTHCMGLISGDFIINHAHMTGFIGANTYGQLSKATMKRIFEVWFEVFGWMNGVHYLVDRKPPMKWIKNKVPLKDYKNTVSFDNGCLIVLGSLDNYKAIDGTEFGWALLDETKDTKEDAVKEVIAGRLRQVGLWMDKDKEGVIYNRADQIKGKNVEGWQPLYIFTSPARVEWLNKWFELDDDFDQITLRCKSKTDFYQRKKGIKHVVISSTYHNAHNLPPNYLEQKLEAWSGDPSKIDRLIFGSPVSKTGGEWFTRFNRQEHVVPCPYDPTLPIHITLDFNVNPYMTLLVSQLHEVDGFYIDKTFKEYCLENPRNNTEDICQEFQYDFAEHEAGVYYYGDPSGKARQTVTKDVKHNYDTLERVLFAMLHNTSDRVLKGAPSLIKSKDFAARLMNKSLKIIIQVDPVCVNLINDFEYLKEGPNGGYLKPKVKDIDTGITYEKLGHTADAWRYKVIALFRHAFDNFV